MGIGGSCIYSCEMGVYGVKGVGKGRFELFFLVFKRVSEILFLDRVF